MEVNRKLGLRAFYGGWKVWICWLPETMRVDTANKFLKLMEEPSDRTVMLFVSEHPDRLLATIQSRVQLVHVPSLRDEEAARGLELNWGSSHPRRSVLPRSQVEIWPMRYACPSMGVSNTNWSDSRIGCARVGREMEGPLSKGLSLLPASAEKAKKDFSITRLI